MNSNEVPLILVVLAACRGGLPPRTRLDQLPTAPSATKYPPQQAAAPAALRLGRQARPRRPLRPLILVLPPNPPRVQATSAQANTSQTPSTAPAKPNELPASTSAQPAARAESGGSPDDSLTVIRKRVDEVNVVFTVTDKRGHFVKDLTTERFPRERRQQAGRERPLVPQRDQSAAARWLAHRRQQLGARPFQVRAGSGHRVPEPDHPPQL